MNLGELRALTRVYLDDTTQPYLWSDSFINAALNSAVNEACDRARLLYDASTPAVTQVTINAGSRATALHESVLDLLSVWNGDHPVRVSNPTELTLDYGRCWEEDTNSNGVVLRCYRVSNLLAVYPRPVNIGVNLTLEVKRLPLQSEAMTSDSHTPVIQSRYHEALVDWVLYKGFSVPDSDRNNSAQSAAAQTRFDRSFGRSVSAKMAMVRDAMADRVVYPIKFAQ